MDSTFLEAKQIPLVRAEHCPVTLEPGHGTGSHAAVLLLRSTLHSTVQVLLLLVQNDADTAATKAVCDHAPSIDPYISNNYTICC